MVSSAEEEYIEEQLEQNRNTPRKIGRNIIEISGLEKSKSKSKSKIGKLIDENGLEYDDQTAADFLNEFSPCQTVRRQLVYR